ncbi:MAG: hypothetical protein OHK0032_05190 [Thermodesulfovibrionales bacterium]
MKWLFRRKGNELDDLLEKARQDNLKSFLVAWNRGLGDIPLGLYAFVTRVRTFIPDAEITFITRKDLEEAFTLFEGVKVIGVPWWQRGRPIDVKGTIEDLNISGRYDMVFEEVNPTKWLKWQIGAVIPRLKWKEEYNSLYKLFEPFKSFKPFNQLFYIGVHVNTETQQFYGNKKDWPMESWNALFDMICKDTGVRVILFGLNKTNTFNHPSMIDLRGETGLLEMLSIIKNCCNILIAPDGGVLSITYYLDVYFPITIISLWGDPNQGILKQAVPSPNPGLVHIPLIGMGNDVSRISVDEVYGHIENSLQKKIL